jgi:hypothetical protein
MELRTSRLKTAEHTEDIYLGKRKLKKDDSFFMDNLGKSQQYSFNPMEGTALSVTGSH